MNTVEYYIAQSTLTDPGRYGPLFDALPDTFAELREAVQGLYIHMEAGEAFGLKIPVSRLPEVKTRYVEKILARIMDLDNRPLVEKRPPEKRFIGCCRDAAVLFCAMSRHKGIPARTRTGFAAYLNFFGAGFNADHEIAEIWDKKENRWRLVDPDLPDITIEEEKIGFDIYDVPKDQFIFAGNAWEMCRAGQANPDLFGSEPDRFCGIGFIRNRLLHDFMRLNKTELLLWDTWGLMDLFLQPTADQLTLLDKIAELTRDADTHFTELRSLYTNEKELTPPDVIMCYSPVSEPEEVTLRL